MRRSPRRGDIEAAQRDKGSVWMTVGQRSLRHGARAALGGLLAALWIGLVPAMASAAAPRQAVLDQLAPAEQREYVAYLEARAAYEAQLDAYWRRIDDKRALRRAKRIQGQPVTAADYVMEQPAVYQGPQLSPALAKRIAEIDKPEPPEPLPVVEDCLRHAREVYGFTPDLVDDRRFKAAYAREAAAVGLSKAQVVNVYAFETGGKGTFDMQAGIDPATRQGRAISTALGYAQLLAANSVNELAKHGPAFAGRLDTLARAPGVSPERRQRLQAKSRVVRTMVRDIARVPNDWNAHRAYARAPKGLAVHTLNLDADVGPWLQVLKLKGLHEEAIRSQRPQLSAAEIELMNLAGPRTGLEMLQPMARDIPTANFFERGGYERNTVVRQRTARGLLEEIDARMQLGMKKPGAQEFAAIFDQVTGGKAPAVARSDPPRPVPAHTGSAPAVVRQAVPRAVPQPRAAAERSAPQRAVVTPALGEGALEEFAGGR